MAWKERNMVKVWKWMKLKEEDQNLPTKKNNKESKQRKVKNEKQTPEKPMRIPVFCSTVFRIDQTFLKSSMCSFESPGEELEAVQRRAIKVIKGLGYRPY